MEHAALFEPTCGPARSSVGMGLALRTGFSLGQHPQPRGVGRLTRVLGVDWAIRLCITQLMDAVNVVNVACGHKMVCHTEPLATAIGLAQVAACTRAQGDGKRCGVLRIDRTGPVKRLGHAR